MNVFSLQNIRHLLTSASMKRAFDDLFATITVMDSITNARYPMSFGSVQQMCMTNSRENEKVAVPAFAPESLTVTK